MSKHRESLRKARPAPKLLLLPVEDGTVDMLKTADVVSLYRGRRWLATLTDGASTVTLDGPLRIFTDPTAPRSICHSTWVRTLPYPFDDTIDFTWLSDALSANRAGLPDILGLAMQYMRGASPMHDGNMQIAGPAAYGPMKDGKRQEGSDFNDYLGVTWNYPDGVADFPESKQFRCLDCSGFVRMLFGFRHSMEGSGHVDTLALCLEPATGRAAIPRRANEIFEAGPGVIVIENARATVDNFDALGVGDLVFFDADSKDGPRLDHVGIYLGIDTAGSRRFISSRKTHNGPTFGDEGGVSTIDGSGLYPRSFRSARRL